MKQDASSDRRPQAVLLIGLQASGKSTLYTRRFASTHLRISMDIAGTRAREKRLLEECIARQLDFAVDNTNSTIAQRSVFIAPAKAAGYRVIGYYFPPDVKLSIERNNQRTGAAKVPIPGIYRTKKYFQPPTLEEGFDELWHVNPDGEFPEIRAIHRPRTAD